MSSNETLPTSWHDRIPNADDLLITTYGSPTLGFGRRDIGVRVLHKPTGIYAACDTERGQFQNREVAMENLVKLLDSDNYVINKNIPMFTTMPRTVPTKAEVQKILETTATKWFDSAIMMLNAKLLEPNFVVEELQEADRNGEQDYWVITVDGEASPGDKRALFELLYNAGWRDTTIACHGPTTEITLYNDVC